MGPLFQRLEQSRPSTKLLYVFLGTWFLINLLQALFTGLHPDEAYYWMYSKFLDWGYFDHPPMVALYIKAGDWIIHNPLSLRLVTVITNTFSIFVLWQIVKPYTKNGALFILLFSSVLIFHVYGFITTPDSPLSLFTILFLYAYQQYLKSYNFGWALALGMLAAALLLSKYHGVLVIFFILLSNLKLFTKGSFWLAMVVAFALFTPHVYWQYLNDYPSIHYHLFERSASPYKFEYTVQYFVDQLLMMGPIMGWYLISSAWKQKANQDLFLSGLRFLVIGVFIFFFLNTFKGRVQAHWPLIEFIPLFILAYIHIARGGINNTYKVLFTVNIGLILVARLILMAAPEGLQKVKFVASYYGYRDWANSIAQAAEGNPVIFQDGFQAPAYYNYYNNTLDGFGNNSYGYRKTQFDIWPIEDSLQYKKVLYVLDHPFADGAEQFSIPTNKAKLYGRFINKVRLYQKLQFSPLNYNDDWNTAELREITFQIENPYDQDVHLEDIADESPVELLYGYYQSGQVVQVSNVSEAYKHLKIPAHGTTQFTITIQAPKTPGKYKLFIALKTAPFPGSRNSSMINVNVK